MQNALSARQVCAHSNGVGSRGAFQLEMRRRRRAPGSSASLAFIRSFLPAVQEDKRSARSAVATDAGPDDLKALAKKLKAKGAAAAAKGGDGGKGQDPATMFLVPQAGGTGAAPKSEKKVANGAGVAPKPKKKVAGEAGRKRVPDSGSMAEDKAVEKKKRRRTAV
jgi:hypothetical protein